ncbi:MAG: alpha/beta hydrolase [Chitinophagales bacterium]|nr:alpha/beta hydrolase [Chitinophagales bacterium]
MDNTVSMNIEYSKLQAGKNPVFFKSLGCKIAADIYLPEGFDSEKKYPAIVYTRVGTQVKEQTGAFYGKKLAAKGYVFLVFDPINFGGSDIRIRNHETMHNVMPNTTDAISFLRTFKFVDRDNFFGLGLCGGAPYICNVALGDSRIKAVGTVVGNFDAAAGLFGTFPKEMIDQMMNVAAEAQQKYYETGEYEMANIFGDMPLPPPENAPQPIKDGYDYYFVRSGHDTYPNYTPEYPTTNLLYETSLSFMYQAKYFTTPFLVVAGENAFTKAMDKEVYDLAKGEKEWFEIKDATQTNMYDGEEYVNQAIDKIDDFFKKYSK